MGVYRGITQDNVTIQGGTLNSVTIAGTSALNAASKVASNLRSGFSAAQQGATIATATGNNDVFVIVPANGVLSSADFSGVDALTANNSNYITFSITNLGQAGAGSAAMLAATDANTTKATGGTGLSANSRRSLTLNGTAANLAVVAGDRLRIRAAVTGTLANTVTFPVYNLNFTVA
jgi:hypothetical protein